MFNWLKRSPPPSICKANPGHSVKVSVGFAHGERSWSEELEIMSCLAGVLSSAGYSYAARKSWIELASGLILQPRFVSLQPLEKRGVQTVTTIEVSEANSIPAGVFEFQHATGDDSEQSVSKGFKDWLQLDLPPLLDALLRKPEGCTQLQFDLPSDGQSPARRRRVVLGPVAHLVTGPEANTPEAHAFCPCCLFTNTASVLKQKVSDDKFYGVRLFAMRDADGSAAADCRLNGEDWEPGRAALSEYVKSWPDRGVEFRKQYVVVQNQPTALSSR